MGSSGAEEADEADEAEAEAGEGETGSSDVDATVSRISSRWVSEFSSDRIAATRSLNSSSSCARWLAGRSASASSTART
jgi:hypothetical protein